MTYNVFKPEANNTWPNWTKFNMQFHLVCIFIIWCVSSSCLSKCSEKNLCMVVILPLSYMQWSLITIVFKPETSNTWPNWTKLISNSFIWACTFIIWCVFSCLSAWSGIESMYVCDSSFLLAIRNGHSYMSLFKPETIHNWLN